MKKTFANAQKQLGDFGSKMKNIVKTGAKMAAGVAAAGVAVGGAAVGMANKFAETADTIDKTSMKMGISSDAFQELQYAMGQVGVSQENFEKGLGRLNQRLAKTDTNEKYRKAIQSIGVSTEDTNGKTRDADAVFMETVKSLHQMEDSTKQAALAQEIFGTRTARELMPAIVAGGDAISDLRSEAQDMGVVIGEDSVKAGVLWADTMDKAKNALGGLFNSIAADALPVLQKLLDKIMDNMPAIQSTVSSAMSKVGDFIKQAFEKAQPAIDWIGNTGIPLAKDAISGMLGTAKTFYNFISNNWSTIKPLLIGIGIALASVKTAMLALSVVQTVTGFIKAFRVATAAARLSMLGLNGAMLANPMTWVVAGIVAVIAAGVLLIKNWDKVSQFLVNTWNWIKELAITVFNGIVEFFKEWGLTLLTVITGPIGALVTLITSNWQMIKNVTAAVGKAIINAFTTAYNWVIGVFSGIGSWFSGVFSVVTGAAKSVGTSISNAFTSAYNGIKNLFSGIGEWFGGIFDGVTSVFKGGVNTVIRFANSAIDKLNGINISIPDWVPKIGGKSFGVNIPKIPALAEGGITTGATLAMIGEGSEQEAVLPLSKLEGLLNDDGGSTTNNNDQTIQVVYSPQYQIPDGASKKEIEQITKQGYNEFKRWMKRYESERNRLSFD